MLFLFLFLFSSAYGFAPCDTAKQCLDAAKAMGLKIGYKGDGMYVYAGNTFVGNYGTQGCYYYTSGKYKNTAFFGTFPGSTPKPEVQSGQTRIHVDFCSNGCDPKENCEREAKARGFQLGGNGYPFVGDYSQGCYYYSSGSYRNMAFFGVYAGDTPDDQTLKSGMVRLNSDCPAGNSYGEWLNHQFSYSTRACLSSPWKSAGTYTKGDISKFCAKICYYDPKCLTFSTFDNSCYTSQSHGMEDCGMFGVNEYYYTMTQRKIFRFNPASEASAQMTMIVDVEGFTLKDATVYGFAAVGLIAVFAGLRRLYKGEKQSQPSNVEVEEI